MNYLDDIEHVRHFYSTLCEYLESPYEIEYYNITMENACIKNDFTQYTTTTEDYLLPYSEDHYIFYVSLRFSHHNKNMRKFKKIYLSMNPHLMIYKEEFKCHRFNCIIFEEEYEKHKSNISYLK